MKKKWNLVLSIATVMLTLTIFVFGVWAAAQPSFTISNQIIFTPNTITANVIGSVAGYDSSKTPIAPAYTHTVDESDPTTFDMPNWDEDALDTLTFVNGDTDIVFTFQITSKTSLAFDVYIDEYNTSSIYITNIASHTLEGSHLQFTSADQNGTPKILTFTVKVKDKNQNFATLQNNFRVVFTPV